MAPVIPILVDALLRLGSIDLAATFVLDTLRKHPALNKKLKPAFLHRLMRTCASHQQLSRAHDLLAELSPCIQTLDQFKACMVVWDRRTPRESLHVACTVWDALVCHPHLAPDEEAYNLYISLKSRLGHLGDVVKIFNNMGRLGLKKSDKTYGLLLKAIGHRQGVSPAWKVLPKLITQGYMPNAYTSNILLSSKVDLSYSGTRSIAEQHEELFISTMQEIDSVNLKFDEVTRNLVVREFLRRAPSHSKEQIQSLKEKALPPSMYNTDLDRKDFRRFRRPLYSMLCSAFQRAGCPDDAFKLKEEWKRESQRARAKFELMDRAC
ncbi:hypothetical protein O181_020784 [Austropuccinia psidii MF-1]|uniref:Pentatricopeptide repeat-containing protein n=1 Tax=Austropuccinia psidii MF-1 TaxID=1389203 RepID=A0A9Q3CBY1_9BASI|nr:hypothetical protein [Austropuccinia psidii MF-1]